MSSGIGTFLAPPRKIRDTTLLLNWVVSRASRADTPLPLAAISLGHVAALNTRNGSRSRITPIRRLYLPTQVHTRTLRVAVVQSVLQYQRNPCSLQWPAASLILLEYNCCSGVHADEGGGRHSSKFQRRHSLVGESRTGRDPWDKVQRSRGDA